VRRITAWLALGIAVCLIIIFANDQIITARAEEASKRKTTIEVTATEYDWWLVRWANNKVACELSVEHEGNPTAQEVFDQCSDDVYNQWLQSKPCDTITAACLGFYLQPVGSHIEEKTIAVDLPLASVTVTLTGCENAAENGPCTGNPELEFTGHEPLPNEQIISIQGDIGGRAFNCPGSQCTVPLSPTGTQGVTVNFWASSSFGDDTETYTAQVRMVPWGDFTNPDQPGADNASFYVEVISSQFEGDQTAGSCSEIWNVFPEVTGPPAWLLSPTDPADLYTSESLYYLSAMLIHNGTVDASDCPDGGLANWNTANECGVDAANGAAVEWQNQFDAEIINVAQNTGIPSQLLKNVFNRESQFWPGIYSTISEAGLGQLTESGTETLLLWNVDFYNQFCPLVLSFEVCDRGFGNMSDANRAMLQGALMQRVDATCATCPFGIDLSKANYSINVFAQTLIGNCEQVNRMLFNTTQRETVTIASYEDLWRFTVVNYNAGPGCLARALQRTYRSRQDLHWENVAANFEPVCRSAVSYLMDISGADESIIPIYNTPLPTSTPTRTPRPTRTPLPTRTITPTRTPTVTRTPTATATPTPSMTPTPSETATVSPSPT